MSAYLVARLEHAPNVEIHLGTQVRELRGTDRLEGVVLGAASGDSEPIPARAVFVMIGADPCTEWLVGTLALDDRGFVLTGKAAGVDGSASPYQTSLPGVFAVGDVRSGSVKRVTSAVGEGSVVVQAVHAYLAAAQARVQ